MYVHTVHTSTNVLYEHAHLQRTDSIHIQTHRCKEISPGVNVGLASLRVNRWVEDKHVMCDKTECLADLLRACKDKAHL